MEPLPVIPYEARLPRQRLAIWQGILAALLCTLLAVGIWTAMRPLPIPAPAPPPTPAGVQVTTKDAVTFTINVYDGSDWTVQRQVKSAAALHTYAEIARNHSLIPARIITFEMSPEARESLMEKITGRAATNNGKENRAE
jgi:hypothetical protein